MKNISKKLASVLLATLALTAFSCNQSTNSTNNTSVDSTSLADTLQQVRVIPLDHAKEFPGSTLTISSLSAEKLGADSAKITIKYGVKNFALTDQTEHEHHMANSAEGQHIHFILNNTPYVALYKPEHVVKAPINSEHYLLSFLSRSFHESIKNADASKLIKFKINAAGQIEEQPIPTEPSIFYSRPKGDYKGKDTQSVLLDFFLVNTDLSTQGNKVKAVVNGKEFILDKWIPYEVTNLPKGENVITLSLIDKDGNALTGDNVSVERKFNILD